jgi:hypothetical protein
MSDASHSTKRSKGKRPARAPPVVTLETPSGVEQELLDANTQIERLQRQLENSQTVRRQPLDVTALVSEITAEQRQALLDALRGPQPSPNRSRHSSRHSSQHRSSRASPRGSPIGGPTIPSPFVPRNTPPSVLSGSVSSHRRSARLPDPPLLSDGEDPTFVSWSILLLGKLEGNADHFPTVAVRMNYVYGRTTGDAQLHLQSRFKPTAANKYTSVSQMLEHLEDVYGNPHESEQARNEYHLLEQGPREPFQNFLTRFQQLANQGGVPPSTWREDLWRKLNLTFQDRLVATQNLYRTYKDLVDQCHSLSTNLASVQHRRQETKRQQASEKQQPPAFRGATAVATTGAKPSGNANPWRSSPAPGSAERINRSATPADAVLTCYNCGKKGHKSTVCTEPRKEPAIHEVGLEKMEGVEYVHESGDEATDSENDSS